MDALVVGDAARRSRTRALPAPRSKRSRIDTTGSSVVPVDANLQPLDDYYLWCDHRAWEEAAQITDAAHAHEPRSHRVVRRRLLVGVGLREAAALAAPQPRQARPLGHRAGALRHGRRGPVRHHRSRGGPAQRLRDGPQVDVERAARRLPAGEFLPSVDPAARRRSRQARRRVCDQRPIAAGELSAEWAERLGLRAGHSHPRRRVRRALGRDRRGLPHGDVVNVVGTSTCIMAIAKQPALIPGVCGVVPGSIHPGKTGVEAGLSATGDIFEAIAQRAGTTVARLASGLEDYRAGQTGLLRLTWDNGDRTVLVNPELGGVTLGWNLTHTAQDELFAAIEGTAFHTRIILERMAEHGVPMRRDDQRRRHSAEEPRAQPGLRERDRQAHPGARAAM